MDMATTLSLDEFVECQEDLFTLYDQGLSPHSVTIREDRCFRFHLSPDVDVVHFLESQSWSSFSGSFYSVANRRGESYEINREKELVYAIECAKQDNVIPDDLIREN